MTIQQVVESDKPFKRENWSHFYFQNTFEGYIQVDDDSGRAGVLSPADILATDWEVKEEPKEEYPAMPNGFKPQVASQAQLKMIKELQRDTKSLLDNLNTHVKNLWACLKGVEDRLNKKISDLEQAETDTLNVINQLVTRDADLSKRVSKLESKVDEIHALRL